MGLFNLVERYSRHIPTQIEPQCPLCEELGDGTAELTEKIKGLSVPKACCKLNSGRGAFLLFSSVVFHLVPVVAFRFVTTTVRNGSHSSW